MEEIEIAIPAYNCAAWLDDLLESILQQGADNWRIVARDDGSTDNTAACLKAWRLRLGERMTIVETFPGKNLGFLGNYNALLAATTSRWVMLADSDDVWHPGKLARTVEAMRSAEATHGPETPLLVFSDAKVVDEQLQPLAESYWQWSRANLSAANTFHRLVVDSPAISSTMMLNRALIRLAMPLTGAVCLDWWAMMVAAAFGKIIRLNEPTISYRRHSFNDSLEPYAATLVGMVHRLLTCPGTAQERLEHLLGRIARQASSFGERFGRTLSPRDRAALDAASRLPNVDGVQRRWTVVRYGLWFGSFSKNVGLMLLL